MLKKSAAVVFLLLLIGLISLALAQVPIPARIGGTITVNGVQLTQATDDGYRVVVTDPGGGAYTPPAEDPDGLNDSDWYIIDIPIHDSLEQPGGAVPGEAAVIHLFKDGTELTVTSPQNGRFTVGNEGSSNRLDIVAADGAQTNRPPVARVQGPAEPVEPGDTVVLDGTGSSDPDAGDTLSYQWRSVEGPAVTLADPASSATTFIAPEVGEAQTLTFELRVTDPEGAEDTARVTVSVAPVQENQPPVAVAAASPPSVQMGGTVVLDGAGSADADGWIAFYEWRQLGGAAVSLSGDKTEQASFIVPDDGTVSGALTFELKVTDNDGLSAADQVTVNVIEAQRRPPAAAAGPDRTVSLGETVVLDGTGSSDPDGTIVAYQWRRVSGPEVALTDAGRPRASFIASAGALEGASLIFELRVTDDHGLEDTDRVTINVVAENRPPVAKAGPDQTVGTGERVTLDGTNSSDPDPGDWITTYLWRQVSGPAVSLADSGAVRTSFVAPDAEAGAAALSFELVVTDSGGLQGSDKVNINISSTNAPPEADAGEIQTVGAGETVVLDATLSGDTDGEIVQYFWEQIGGTPVTLQGAGTARASFSAPTLDIAGEALVFRLTVTDDGGLKDSDTTVVNLTVTNIPPDADIRIPETVTEGTTATLDASNSSDSDGRITAYQWTQTGGPPVTLADAMAAATTFVAPPVGPEGALLRFELAVTDDSGLQDGDEVDVTVADNGITLFPDDAIPFTTVTGRRMGMESAPGDITRLVAVDPEALGGGGTTPGDLIYGALELEVKMSLPGDGTTLTIHLPEPAPAGHRWYGWIPGGGWSVLDNNITFNANRDRFNLPLVDGRTPDQDFKKDRFISATVALGGDTVPPETPVTRGGAGDTNHCFIGSAGGGAGAGAIGPAGAGVPALLLILAGAAGRRLRRRFRF